MQVKIENGKLAVDRDKSRLDLKKLDARFPGWTEAQLKADLLEYADRTLAAQGPVLRLLVLAADAESDVPSQKRIAEIDAGIAGLADADTAALRVAKSNWATDTGRGALAQWRARLSERSLSWAPPGGDPTEVLRRVARNAFGDGPLLSMDRRAMPSLENQLRNRRLNDGVLSFVVSPPFAAKNGLQVTTNASQWERMRAGFGKEVLKEFDGRLWRRSDMLQRAQDYMALRGVELRAWRRKDEPDVACGLVDAESQPEDYPGIVLMRPRMDQDASTANIIVSSDPLPEAIYVVAGPDQQKLVLRALYLLLPTTDFSRVNAVPKDYLQQATEDWLLSSDGKQLTAWRLKMTEGPGSELRFADMLMTRSVLAERLQRLALLHYQARITRVTDLPISDTLSRRQGMLVLEPIADPASAVDKKQTPLDTAELGDVAAPIPLAQAPRAPSPRRHHLRLGVEHHAGKPLKAFGSFRRDGFANEDTVVVDFGHNGALQGAAAYERDFVGFEQLGRRLQLSARVYTDYTPDRVVDTVRTDVRRKGAQASGTLDLWPDWHGSFGQAEFTLAREQASIAGTVSGAAAPTAKWVQRVDSTLTVARSQPGTATAMHDEAVVSTSFARADSGSFQRASVALNHHQFVGFFDRVDFRFFARGVSHRAPATELPTFGGDESVRGLREDQATGRGLWALQSEWWMPIPWKTDNGRLASVFRRQMALAAWVDTGAIYRPTTPIARRHTALGLGLRYTQGDELTLRLDVARPVAGLNAEQRHTRLLLTVTMRPRL